MPNLFLPDTLPVPRKDKYWQQMDSTKLQTFARCPRRYFFEYVVGWRKEGQRNDLAFGRAWHEALELLYKEGFNLQNVDKAFEKFLDCYRKDYPPQTDEWFKSKNPDNAFLALIEYINQWASDVYEVEVLATEAGGEVGIGSSRAIITKLDLIGRNTQTGKVFALEHKTGSKPGEVWAAQWRNSLQIGSYIHALNANYENEGRIIVNGTFFQVRGRQFQRVVCERSFNMMAVWLETVHSLIDDIDKNFLLLQEDEEKKTVMEAFRQHPTSCTDYGGCPYLDICTCVNNPLRLLGQQIGGFEEFWWNPLSELEEKE